MPETATPPIEFTHSFDQKFVRDAIKRDFWWRMALVIVVVILAIAAIVWTLGIRPWEMPMVSGLVAGGLGGVIVAFFKLNQLAKRTFDLWERLSPERRIRYRLHQDAIEVEMPNGTGRYEWAGMRRLWRYPDIWLLEVVKNVSVLFPPDAPAEAQRFVVERCQAAGIRT